MAATKTEPKATTPSKAAPFEDGQAEGLTGVVFGSGPSIDRIPDAELRAIKSDRIISVGCNMAGLHERFHEADFLPDALFIWDPAPRETAPAEALQHSIQVFHAAGRHSISIERGPDGSGRDQNHPTRQRLTAERHSKTLATGVHASFSCADAAIHMLYLMGVRTFYLYGIDMHTGYCRLRMYSGSTTGRWDDRQRCYNGLQVWKKNVMPRCDVSVRLSR